MLKIVPDPPNNLPSLEANLMAASRLHPLPNAIAQQVVLLHTSLAAEHDATARTRRPAQTSRLGIRTDPYSGKSSNAALN